MPYITEDEKDRIGLGHQPSTVGQLTYAITRECNAYAATQGTLKFMTIALVMGALVCAMLEFYRRRAVPYEEGKIKLNGDAYD
jgi:hypothetical protein